MYLVANTFRYLHRRSSHRGEAKLGPVELSILLFADDIALVADNVRDLQAMLVVADEYSKMYRFGFNGSKSNVVVFSGNRKVKLEEKLYLGEIERSEERRVGKEGR